MEHVGTWTVSCYQEEGKTDSVRRRLVPGNSSQTLQIPSSTCHLTSFFMVTPGAQDVWCLKQGFVVTVCNRGSLYDHLYGTVAGGWSR